MELIIKFLEALGFAWVAESPLAYHCSNKGIMISIFNHNDTYSVFITNTKHTTIEFNDLVSELDCQDTIFEYLLDEASDLLESKFKYLPARYHEPLLKLWAESNGYDVKDSNILTAYINYINSKEVR